MSESRGLDALAGARIIVPLPFLAAAGVVTKQNGQFHPDELTIKSLGLSYLPPEM
jgi:hypothetical protein